jgi:hypothetical protein
VLPAPPENAVRGRLTDAMLTHALADEALTSKLIDELIAGLPAEAARQRKKKPKAYPVAVIPLGHGLGAMATFALAVVTAIGVR